MKTIALLGGAACLVGLAIFGFRPANHNLPKSGGVAQSHSADRVPVLVELFTSEGCSSCPPADALLAKLKRDQPIAGATVIPLSEHVDYWNSASWRDRFSSPLFSQRQEAYVKAMGLDGPYTPQMVVNGARQCVGSDADAAADAIRDTAMQASLPIKVEASGNGNSATVKFTVDMRKFGGQLYVALTEDNLESQVTGGENGGNRLAHSAVVRILKPVSVRDGNASLSLTLNPEWKRQDLHVVAFVQAEDGKILGVQEVDIRW